MTANEGSTGFYLRTALDPQPPRADKGIRTPDKTLEVSYVTTTPYPHLRSFPGYYTLHLSDHPSNDDPPILPDLRERLARIELAS